MSEIILNSGSSQAFLLPHRGGLITSLRLAGHEKILWLPENFDPSSSAWPGGGLPFLFPFAGRVQNQGELYKYALDEKIYPMPIHGFSWATAWTAKSISKNRVTLSLKSDGTSKSIYPFDFDIQMTITLSASKLDVDVTVSHIKNSQKPRHAKMPVALGWHPYFALHGSSNIVEIPAQTVFPVTAQGLAGQPMDAGEFLGPQPLSLPNEKLQSLILSDLSSNGCELWQPASGSLKPPGSIRIEAGPGDLMKHIVTWTNDPGVFHCIEPWMSRPDAVATPTGCRWLDPGESLKAWLQISVG